jgi:hypothetical protein
LFDVRSGHVVEDRQQSIGLLGSRMGPASQLGDTGRALLEQRQQQSPGDRQADAFGLSCGGEAGELIGIEDDSLLALLVEVIAFSVEAVVVLGKVVKLLAVIGAVNSLHDPWRVAVERLPGGAGECGLAGDGTVGTIENSGGVGDAKRRR